MQTEHDLSFSVWRGSANGANGHGEGQSFHTKMQKCHAPDFGACVCVCVSASVHEVPCSCRAIYRGTKAEPFM